MMAFREKRQFSFKGVAPGRTTMFQWMVLHPGAYEQKYQVDELFKKEKKGGIRRVGKVQILEVGGEGEEEYDQNTVH